MKIERKTRRVLTLIAVVGVVLVCATPAFAHSVDKRFGDFYGGMLHPITAVEHLLPIIGLSLLAGQQGPKPARWILLAFPVGLLIGASIALYAGPSEHVMWLNRMSFVVLGILVAAAIRIPLPALAAISLLFGTSHGFENTADISETVALRMFMPGLLVSGFALVAIVAAFAVSLKVPWQQIAIRVAGSWIAAIGLLALGAT